MNERDQMEKEYIRQIEQQMAQTIEWASEKQQQHDKQLIKDIFGRGYHLGVRHEKAETVQREKQWQAKVDEDKQTIANLKAEKERLELELATTKTQSSSNGSFDRAMELLQKLENSIRGNTETVKNAPIAPNPPDLYRG